MGSVDQDRTLVEENFYSLDFLFQTLSIVYLIKLEAFDSVQRGLIKNIVILFEAKSFDYFGFNPMFITIVWGCGETNAECSVYES